MSVMIIVMVMWQCGCGHTKSGRVTGGQVSLAEEIVCLPSIPLSGVCEPQISLLRRSHLFV